MIFKNDAGDGAGGGGGKRCNKRHGKKEEVVWVGGEYLSP